MYQKQNTILVEAAVVIVVLSISLSVWIGARSFSLVAPQSTNFFNNDTNSTPASTPLSTEQKSQEPLLEENPLEELNQSLTRIVKSFTDLEPNEYSIVISHIDTGLKVEHRADRQMSAASLYKIFLAVETLKLVDSGNLSLKTTLPEAQGRTVGQCITDSVTWSDNVCSMALLNITGLGTNAGLAILRESGYKSTDLRGEYTQTSANDVLAVLREIYDGQTLSKASRQKLLNDLKNQQISNRLPQGLPSDIAIAHKTGDLEGYVHDAGIVISPIADDYIVVVMSEPDTSGRTLDERYARFGELMSGINNAMTNYFSD